MYKEHTYKIMYRCKLCGKKFERKRVTCCKFVIALVNNYLLIMGQNFFVGQNELHYCENGGVGCAEFIGFEEAEDEKEGVGE